MLRMQSREIRSLDDYFAEESAARPKNLVALDAETEMARSLFLAAQELYANFPTGDRPYSKVIASLLAACIRYYGSAVDLCLRGNAAEALSLMRSCLEQAGYVVKIASEPSLAEKWVDLDELETRERFALFGRDSELMQQELLKPAEAAYGMFSEFGVHARIPMTEQTIDFTTPAGWRIRHAEVDTEHLRWSYLGVLFIMRDLLDAALVPTLLEPPLPPEIAKHLEDFESHRKKLGSIRCGFRKF